MKTHHSSPLSDYIEYTPDEILQRSTEFYENMKRRHSVRSFSDRLVAKQIIENCIKAAGTSPSGVNHQPWYFVAINNIDVKKQIRQQAEIH
jgi:iodotyrosine deiodinase